MSSPQHKRCLGCGYILDGLPENRCPECGREFDPDAPETYQGKPQSGRPYLIAAICGLLAMAIAFPLPRLGAGTSWIFLVLIAAGFATEVVVLDAAIRALRRPRSLLAHRLAFILALLISLSLVLLFVVSLFIPPRSMQ